MLENYDQNELNKFGAIAAHWWDPNGEVKTLHEINPIRLSYITKKVNLDGKQVLDVGCGGGILSESLSKEGASVTAIDLDESLLNVAKLHQYESKTNVNYRRITVEALATDEPTRFDVITCMELLEHVPDPVSVINACSSLIKPGGHLFFSTLNRNIKSYLFAIIGAEYILKLLPKNTHDYAKFIRPSELSKWLRAASIETLDIKGMTYHPFTKTFQLSSDINVNYLIHAKKKVLI